jgi:hypothetical protein
MVLIMAIVLLTALYYTGVHKIVLIICFDDEEVTACVV